MDTLFTLDQPDSYKSLKARASQCVACPLAMTRTNIVFGSGNSNKPNIMFVLGFPTEFEDKSGIPFSDPHLDFVRKQISEIETSIYFTYGTLCRQTEIKKDVDFAIKTCNTHLLSQIANFRPKKILLLGNKAIRALLKEEEDFTLRSIDNLRFSRSESILYRRHSLSWTLKGTHVQITHDPINATEEQIKCIKEDINRLLKEE